MNLEKELLKQQTLEQCKRIINWVGNDAERYAQLMKLFLRGDYRITQHAAWPMSYCIRKYPDLAKPYFKKWADLLQDQNTAIAAKRNIVRLLQYVEIPARQRGRIMSSCFQFIEDPLEAIAVKAFSLTILQNLAKQYPEIIGELKTVIESRWPFETPAFHSRAKKILVMFKT